MKDLTVSSIDRQNILNNNDAIKNIQSYLGISGMLFEGEYRFTKQQVANFYAVEISTIEWYLANHESELKQNGYVVLKGAELRNFKREFEGILQEGSKAPQLGVFNFRAFLNLGMLLSESEKAKAIRSAILNIVIDTISKKLGGTAKYINQRDEDFLFAIIKEPDYRKHFTSALSSYLDMGNYKYEYYTDAIYRAIFKENANEYKQILQLEEQDNLRATLYSEVLLLIASFENGIADTMKRKSERLGRKLSPVELDTLIIEFSNQTLYIPLIEDARRKMASRDYGFREIIHDRLESYIQCVPSDEYDRFLGEKSMDLIERIKENIHVFERLKDK
jgi:hypothetical protein